MMSDSEKMVYTLLEVFIAVGCCVGNVLVIWAVCSCRALCQTTFCFVVSLAVADFLVGAVAVPLAVVVDGRVETSFHSCLLISCVVIVLTQASVHSLLAIAVDRYLRVYNPYRYRGAVRKQNLRAAVTVCWLSASVLGLIPLSGWHNIDTTTSVNSTLKCHFLTVISMSYMVNFNFLVCILSPTIIMMAIYAFIFFKISRQLRREIGETVESRTFYHKERRLAHSLALVLALFAVSWFPLHILNTLTYYTSVSVPPLLFHIGCLLSHANSAVNPIVYAFKIPKIKIAYKNILKKLTGSKENPDQISQTLDNNISSNSNSNVRCSVKNSQKDKTNINQDA
ncbi:Adenosine receptor A1 [Triplophysa tibetana]|uniref:Adenosine receptor A1 n=1 Tax=Triplophysa tibetana TaxID=1572043 RepID=A0A5A9NRK8_9TELE|nr:Adenosine receptor A1 [Triplophysa tibetana]KAA0713516.1 Adenosine receptor A1 [Triplophysa tibetana]